MRQWQPKITGVGFSIVDGKELDHRTFTINGLTIEAPAKIDFSTGVARHATRKGMGLYALPAGRTISELGEFI